MISPFPVVFANEDGDDEVRDEHADATAEQQLSTSKAIHAPQRPETGDDLADVEDPRHCELHFVA